MGKKCFVCGASIEKRPYFDAVTDNGREYLCTGCAKKHDFDAFLSPKAEFERVREEAAIADNTARLTTCCVCGARNGHDEPWVSNVDGKTGAVERICAECAGKYDFDVSEDTGCEFNRIKEEAAKRKGKIKPVPESYVTYTYTCAVCGERHYSSGEWIKRCNEHGVPEYICPDCACKLIKDVPITKYKDKTACADFFDLKTNLPLDGVKDDDGKARWSLLPYEQLEEVVKVLGFGADKYGDDNWKKVKQGGRRYMDAAMRHIAAMQNGKVKDPESGLSHAAHAVCCLLFVMWMRDND
jgi:hypothetical protein